MLNIPGGWVFLTNNNTEIKVKEFKKIAKEIRQNIPEEMYHLNGQVCANTEFYNFLWKELKKYGFKILRPKIADL